LIFHKTNISYFTYFCTNDIVINEIELEGKIYTQWYYYKIDVVAEFVCPQENTETGWEISFAFSLDPLKYYTNGDEKEE